MNTVYHMSYTKLRTIDLVLADICANPVGTLIEDAVRSIAARIGRSAGGITPALKRLAADGWISYLSDGRGSLIEVLKTDQHLDRSIAAEAPVDQAPIAPASDESPNQVDQESDRSFAASPCDQASDRSACMVDHESRTQEEELARGLLDHLLEEPSMNRSLAERIAKHPIGTVADFMADLRVAQTFAKRPFYFTVARWRDSQRVIAPEVHDERPERSSPVGTRRRSAPNRPEQAADPATDADYAALLAEIRAARPLTAEELGLPVPGQWGAAACG